MKAKAMGIANHWPAAICCVIALASPSRAADEFRIGVPFPEGARERNVVDKAITEIVNATDGEARITLESFSPKQIDLGQRIFSGDLQGGLVMGKGLTRLHRDALAYAIPFTFKSAEQLDYVRKSLDPVILRGLSVGPYEALGIVEYGFAYVMSSKSLSSPADWRKRKIWTPADDKRSLSLTHLDLKTVPLPLGDVRSILGDKVDTVIVPPPLAIHQRWHTKTKEVFETPFVYTYGIWIVRKDAIASLTVEDRRSLRAGLSSLCRELSAAFRDRNGKGLDVLRSWGHELSIPDADMQDLWAQWAQDVWRPLTDEQRPTAEVEARIRELLRAFDKKDAEENLKQPIRVVRPKQ